MPKMHKPKHLDAFYFTILLCVIFLILSENGIDSSPVQNKTTELNSFEVLFSQPLLPREKENCSRTFLVYIKETGECVPQVPVHSICTYDRQCESLTHNSICVQEPSSGKMKTCQCKENYIPSGKLSSCVPKRPCQPSTKEISDDSFFNIVVSDKGSCPQNGVCLRQLNYCGCKNGYGFDDYAKCVMMDNPYPYPSLYSGNRELSTVAKIDQIDEEHNQTDLPIPPQPSQPENNNKKVAETEIRIKIQNDVDEDIGKLNELQNSHEHNIFSQWHYPIGVVILLVPLIGLVIYLKRRSSKTAGYELGSTNDEEQNL